MNPRLFSILMVTCLLTVPYPASAAKSAASLHCYQTDDPVSCFVSEAQAKLVRVTKRDDRADAIGEMLYALSAIHRRDDAIMKEATDLSTNETVPPVKQMDLLYALDIYASTTDGSADQTYLAALRRFAALQQQLKGSALVELYMNACTVIAWDDPFRERWMGFAQKVCTPQTLLGMKQESVSDQVLVLAMMPVAMALSENTEGFGQSADLALTWLRGAETGTTKSKKRADMDFVASIGVLMHTMNSLSLDLLDEPEAAEDEIDAARKTLRRLEMRVGLSGANSSLRRQVIDSMFNLGREADAKKMLRQMLARIDTDPKGNEIAFQEQVAILLQAARLAHEEKRDRLKTCSPEGDLDV